MNSKYFKEEKIGEGTFAVVYAGWSLVDHHLALASSSLGTASTTATTTTMLKKESSSIKGATPTGTKFKIAIKKIKVKARQPLDISSIRELASLQELSHHPNIIRLLDVFHHKGAIHMVLPFIPTDLETIIKRKSVVFSNAHVKSWMLMLLRGLDCMHELGWLHRDLKPNNLLLDRQGLKIADFGLCRPVSLHEMTPQAVTRWYRPPELLLGATRYSYSVDMWSVGCIFAELCLRVPFVAGDTDLSQLDLIFKALGTPTTEQWPGIEHLPGFYQFNVYPKPDLNRLFSALGRDGLDILFSFLAYDPTIRISAKEALDSAFFQNDPAPTLPCFLPGATDTSNVEAPAVREADLSKKRKQLDQDPQIRKLARKLF